MTRGQRGFVFPLTLVLMVLVHSIYLGLLRYQAVLARKHEGYQRFSQTLIQKELVTAYHEEQIQTTLPDFWDDLDQVARDQTQRALRYYSGSYDLNLVYQGDQVKIYEGQAKYSHQDIQVVLAQALLVQPSPWQDQVLDLSPLPGGVGWDETVSPTVLDLWEADQVASFQAYEAALLDQGYQALAPIHRQESLTLYLPMFLDRVFDFGDSLAHYSLDEHPSDHLPQNQPQFKLKTYFDSSYYQEVQQTMPQVPEIQTMTLTCTWTYLNPDRALPEG